MIAKNEAADFKRRLEENRKALINDNLTIQVYKEDRYPFGTHTTKLVGNMRNNGFVYLSAYQIAPYLDLLAKSSYPIKLSGKIEWSGKITLQVIKTKFKLVGSRIPKTFKGSIDKNGGIRADLTHSEFELYGEGFMDQLIIDPFNGNEAKRLRFVKNTIQLNQAIIGFIEKIKESH